MENVTDDTKGEKGEPSVFSDFSVFKKRHDDELADVFTMQHKDRYLPARIASCYSLFGLPLRNHKIMVMGEELDTRLSYIIAIRSGNWKKGFENLAFSYCNELGYKISKIVSLHHEQLIGKNETGYEKVGKKNIRITEEREGLFKDDFLVGGDALPLLNSNEFEMSRNYFIQALDEFGYNEVTKKLVNQNRKETLRYYPKFSALLFVQDKPISKDSIDTGLARKSPIIYIDAPDANEETYLNRALNTSKADYGYLFKIAKKAKNASSIAWTFSEEAHRFIAKRTHELKSKFETYGAKGKDYASMFQFAIQNNLYKYAVILATYYTVSTSEDTELKIQVTPEICQAASEDYENVLWAAFEHWLKYVEDSNVLTLSRWEQYVVKELNLVGAVSEEKAIFGNTNFLMRIAEKADVSVSTIYNACRYLKKKGIVEVKQVGKGEAGKENSKMWLLK